MEILTPQKVRSDKRTEAEESARNVALSQAEEDRIVRSLNMTRDSAEEEKREIAADVEKIRKDAEARKLALKNEVEALEARKREALKPVTEQKKTAEDSLMKAQMRHAEADDREKALIEREQGIFDKKEAVNRREDKVIEDEAAAAKKNREIDEREEVVRRGVQALDAARLDHAKKVAQEDARLSSIEAKNAVDTQVNATERARLNKKDVEHADKDREIAFRFAQLEKTAAWVRKMAQEHGIDTQG